MDDTLDFTSDFYDIEAVLEKRDRELLAGDWSGAARGM
jgi:hypothetical protein